MNTNIVETKRNCILMGWLALALWLAGASLEASTVLGPYVPIFKGIEHAAGTNTPGGGGFPDLQVVHILRVDLTDPDIQLITTPRITNYVANSRETAGLTVSDFVKRYHVQAAINGNFFDPSTYYLPAGTPMYLTGLAISQGQVVSAQEGPTDSAAIMFTTNNEPRFVFTNWPAASTVGVYTALSGDYPILINNSNVGYRYRSDSGFVHQLQPRTAYGVSQDRRYLFLLTIDGRQPGYSNGAYDYETGAWLQLAGASDGINMDGGGSTTLVVQDSTGNPVRLNNSSAVADSGKERTLGSHFGIFAKPVPGFINEVQVVPDDTTAVVTWTTTSPATTQVQYGDTPEMGLTTNPQSDLMTNHTVLLTQLTPDTGYYFQAISTVGTTQYMSSNLFFMTTNYASTNLLFDLTNIWTYTTANLDGVDWTAPGYDDTGWLGSGPGLLWVDVRSTGPNPDVNPKNTQMPPDPNNSGFPFVTYYFRTHFLFTNSLPGVTFVFSNYLDDGAVFYLNGVEIYRLDMDAAPAPINNNTLAISYGCSGDATCAQLFTIAGDSMTNLITGDNVLAVEVHNYNARSPDITFGTALFYTEPSTFNPTLDITAANGIITLNWSRPGFILQQADSLKGEWTDVPGPVLTSPFTTNVSSTERFFRLQK